MSFRYKCKDKTIFSWCISVMHNMHCLKHGFCSKCPLSAKFVVLNIQMLDSLFQHADRNCGENVVIVVRLLCVSSTITK